MMLKMTRETALKYGLLVCTCGCPENNHFLDQRGKPCAHCPCDKFCEVSKRGITIVKKKRKEPA